MTSATTWTRRVPLLTAVVALLLPVGAVSASAGGDTGATAQPPSQVGTADTSPPQVRHRYRIETRGSVATDPDAFAETVGTILGDARGWTLGGSIALGRTGGESDFNVVLASPAAVDAAHPVCSPHYSCRVGEDVLINDRNWRDATSEWRQRGAGIAEYRRYLINHEVGHWLGFDHRGCPAAGADAPVMMQQSIDIGACEPNGWPVDAERTELADRFGVPIYDDWIFVDVLRGQTHRDQIHAVAEAEVALGRDGAYFPTEAVTRAQMASFLARALDLHTTQDPPFDDVDPDQTHASAIAALAEEDIAFGRDGSYFPTEPVTRAQMASLLTRALGY